MSGVEVLHIHQIKPEYFIPTVPKRNQNGGLRVDLEYKDPNFQKIYLLQTPKLRLPFGLGAQEKENQNTPSYSLSLSFDGYKSNKGDELEFVRGIEEIDTHVKRLASENSKVWFKKTMPMSVIEELFHPSIRYSDDWPPLFKAKVPFWSGRFNCEFYDSSRTKCTPESISNGSYAIGLIQLTSLWFVNQRFGCNWTLKQGQIFPSVKMDTFLIKQENENEEYSDNSNRGARSRSRSRGSNSN